MGSTVIPRLRKIKDVTVQMMTSTCREECSLSRIACPSHPSMDEHDLFWIG